VTDTAVIIFTKAPIPGSVKTRLCPPLTPDEAASLHGTLVLDAVERTKGLSAITLYVACAPDIAHPFFKVLEGRYGARLLPQEGEDLGARMHGVVQQAFELGHSRTILIGTDLPTLGRSHFTQAIDDLRSHDIVLGPTLDGGYYLIGLRRPAPDLFHGIPWSTTTVLEETRKKAATLGLSEALLPSLRDLDDLDDLKTFVSIAGRDKSLSKRTEATLLLLGTRLKQRGVSVLG
jgi:rSAM/selenodomain-associated transferase 1